MSMCGVYLCVWNMLIGLFDCMSSVLFGLSLLRVCMIVL